MFQSFEEGLAERGLAIGGAQDTAQMVSQNFGKTQTGGLTNGGLSPKFSENRGEIGSGKSGLSRASWGLFGADWDQLPHIPQPRGKTRNCPERALFGPIGAFQANPPFAKPPFGFPSELCPLSDKGGGSKEEAQEWCDSLGLSPILNL